MSEMLLFLEAFIDMHMNTLDLKLRLTVKSERVKRFL